MQAGRGLGAVARNEFPRMKLFFIHPDVKNMLLPAFQNSTLPACVKTEVGRRFHVNSVCYKFLMLLLTMILWS